MFVVKIEGFDVKTVDEYHLTGVEMDIFVGWAHRPPSTNEGRSDGRGEAKAKPEPKSHVGHSGGMVTLNAQSNPFIAVALNPGPKGTLTPVLHVFDVSLFQHI